MVNGWKVTAIIFICLFVSLLVFNIWGYTLIIKENNAVNNCYYNTCEVYPEAWYEDGLCTCYDFNEYGEYEIVKTVYHE